MTKKDDISLMIKFFNQNANICKGKYSFWTIHNIIQILQYQNLHQIKPEYINNKKSVVNYTTEVHVGAGIACAGLKIYNENKKI